MSKNQTPAIILENVTKSFIINRENILKHDFNSWFRQNKKKVTPVKNLNMTIYKGESVGLYGPNGVGKTTILKLISGITYPDSGKIIVKGKVVPIIELFAGLHPELTGLENIHTNTIILGIQKSEYTAIAQKIIDFAGIKDYIYNPVKKYSMGMKARLSIAIALHTKPDILLIDESLTVGDEAFKTKTYDALKKVSQQTTFIAVSHSKDILNKFCNRIIEL